MSSRTDLFAFARNTVLRAGAGTGKTEALATVYLHLVSGLAAPEVWSRQGVLPERIVALTFTEKAALEMRERIAEAVALLSFEALPAALQSADPLGRERALTRWAQSRGLSPAVAQRVRALADSAADQLRELPRPETWQRIGFALGAARIGTFHGFAAGILRGAALELGIDPGFEVADQEEADRLLRDATVAALATAARRDVAAVADLMAAAGGIDVAGDHGLVPTLAEMVRRLDEAGTADRDVGVRSVIESAAVPTFIAAAAVADLARACVGVPALADDGTASALARLAERVGLLGSVDTPPGARACVELLRALPLPPRTRTQRVQSVADGARAALEGLRDAALATLSTELARVARDVVLATRTGFRAAKLRRGVLDFADLMHRLRDALRDRPALRRACKRRFDAVLVDEFQDTNRVQRDLLYLLRERRDQEQPGIPAASELEPAGLLLVGDAKQSIYAFRGADVSVFFDSERELAAAGGARHELLESHRSLDEVIGAVNPATEALLGAGLIAHAESMYDRSRDALQAEQHGDGQTRVELLYVAAGNADEVRSAEADALARRILALVAAPAPHPEGWRPVRFDEIAVLVPSWSHLDPIKRALKERGVPYALLGGPGFWARREVDDLIVLLRFVADPNDRMALAALLRGPLVGISDAALARLFARPGTVDDLLDPPAPLRLALETDDRARLDEARPTLRRLLRFGGTLGPEAVLRLALTERAYAAVLATLPFGAQKVANVDKLVGLAAAAERRGGEEADIPGFLRYVDRMRAAARHETEADVADVAVGAVQILSIHAAKGLEWPVVFVAQTSRRRRTHGERLLVDTGSRVMALPAGFVAPDAFREIRRDVHAAEDDDQRRLLYVALTRARDMVVVSGPVAEGEGEWRALSLALMAQSPTRVRIVRPGEDAPAVRVRAGAADEREAPLGTEALVHAMDAPQIPRRRLVIHPGALAEFEACPRRYFALHELRLDERLGPRRLASRSALPAQPDEALEALRRLLARIDTERFGSDPRGALDASVCALGGVLPAPALTLALDCAAALPTSPLGRVLATRTDVIARALPYALALGREADSVALHGQLDLLVRGEALGRDGVVALQYTLEPSADSARHAFALAVAALSVTRRLGVGGGEAPHVHVAFARFAAEGVILEFLEGRGLAPEALEQRALETAARLRDAHTRGEWTGRNLGQCERLGCGFAPRCHGA